MSFAIKNGELFRERTNEQHRMKEDDFHIRQHSYSYFTILISVLIENLVKSMTLQRVKLTMNVCHCQAIRSALVVVVECLKHPVDFFVDILRFFLVEHVHFVGIVDEYGSLRGEKKRSTMKNES